MDNRIAIEVKKYFKVADGTISLTGGAKRWNCLFCKKTITGSATKLRAHLLGVRGANVAACVDVPDDTQNAIRGLEAEHPDKKAGQLARSYVFSSSSSGTQPSVADVFARLDKDEVDQLMADWFYVNGIPFNAVRCGSQA